MDEAPEPPMPGSGRPDEGTANPDPEAAEIRRLVEEGAGSPEALRELAARLRAQRDRENERWRTEVKPALVKSRKRGAPLPPHLRAPTPSLLPPMPSDPPVVAPPAAQPPLPAATAAAVPPPTDPMGSPPPPPAVSSSYALPESPIEEPSRPAWVFAGVLAVLAAVVVALNTSVWLLLVPVVGLLVWAWREGRRDTGAGGPTADHR